MAETTLNLASRVQKWDAQFLSEYVRENLFRPYMGTYSKNSLLPILAKHELTAGGKTVNMPLLTKLDPKSGVRGTARLIGREVALGNYNHSITVNWSRNAVTIKKPEEHWSEIELRNGAKMFLKSWASDSLRDDIICAQIAFSNGSWLRGRPADDVNMDDPAQTPAEFYASFDESTKDAWLAANADRFLFGAAKANNAANDHSAALAQIDNTSDKLTTDVGSLAKAMARETANNDGSKTAIRPIKVENGEGREWFVMFCNSRSFRDLKKDSAMIQANRDARPREVGSNPLFQDGDLVYDGVIYREIPEIPVINNGTIDVAPNFLCGAQAIGIAWGQEPQSGMKAEDDYGFEWGVSITECRAASKMTFRGLQHGMVTVYTAAVASA